MAQALTHQMIAREAAKILVEENVVVKNINTNRSVEFGEEINGYKKGETVKVMIPPVPTVYDGTSFAGGGAAPSQAETFVNLTLDTQKHVPLSFTAKEKKLDLTDFKKRFLRPAMVSLSSAVNADLLVRMKNQTPNVVGTWGTIPATRRVWRQASSLLNQRLAPEDMRSVHFSSDANLELAEANSTLFHTSDEIRKEFDKNAVGVFAGFEFFEQQSVPVHTNGAGAGYVTNGAGQTGSIIAIDTGTGAIPKGSIITFAGVNAVHPTTGQSLGYLRQFVVTADYAGGAGNISIYPALTPHSATVMGTVDVAVADGAAMVIFGTAGQSKRQNLAFHKNAFAGAFAPLPVLASCEGYTATIQGISVRVMTFGDGKEDIEHTRIDVLYGEAAVRADHSVRVTE